MQKHIKPEKVPYSRVERIADYSMGVSTGLSYCSLARPLMKVKAQEIGQEYLGFPHREYFTETKQISDLITNSPVMSTPAVITGGILTELTNITIILMVATTIAQFNQQLSNLKKQLGSNLHEFLFTTLIQGEHISYKFLNTTQQKTLKTTSKHKVHSLDETDCKILKLLSQSARLPVTKIAQQTGIGLHTVHYRLKQLKKNKIIQGFRPKIRVQSTGLQWHLLLIRLNPVSIERTKKFIEYYKQHKNVYYVTNTVGTYDIMLDIHVPSTEEFRKLLFNLKDKFSDLILLYESILVFDELLITYVPPIILDKFQN